jgi:hypothetical protein
MTELRKERKRGGTTAALSRFFGASMQRESAAPRESTLPY